MPTSRSSGAEPKVSAIASTVFGSMPLTVPARPQWATPIARCTGSNSTTGAQSATTTASAVPGRSVISPSVAGKALREPATPSWPRPARDPIDDRDPVRVLLGGDGQPVHAEGGGHPAPVLPDRVQVVSDLGAQVEAGVGAGRHAAVPGGDDGGHPVPVERERAQRKPGIHPATLTARPPSPVK